MKDNSLDAIQLQKSFSNIAKPEKTVEINEKMGVGKSYYEGGSLNLKPNENNNVKKVCQQN